MADPIHSQFGNAPARVVERLHVLDRFGKMSLIIQIALGLRIVAACAVDLYVRSSTGTRLCVFPDTNIYWALARTIRAGTTFEYVEWSDIPHFAIRTPGYPLFLAACHACFGERTLAVRLVQAVLGAVSVYLVYRLACLVLSRARTDASDRPGAAWTRSVPLVAAAIAAANPYYVLMSSLILSEAVFVPLSLATLCGLAALWDAPGQPVTGRSALRRDLIALLSGIAAGAAILVRPSWLLFLPAVIAIWLFIAARDRTSFFPAARAAGVFALAVAIVMGPWWVRNARVYGRFVPTALWAGASLYDGLNESATGASDMSFLFDPAFWPLDEEDQDAELTRRAVAFVREQPVRALELAWVKLLRFWSPWPNAGVFQIPALALASTLVTVPLFALLAIGIWDHRLDPKAWVLLLGPLLYFCALHLAFASSVRYRIPAEMPALGLAALGWLKIQAKFISASRPPLATG